MSTLANHPAPIAVTIMTLGQVKPDPSNPRRHSKRQVQKLAAAYGEFGYISPLLVDEHATIIAGHGRWLAAERLGLAEVPVIVLRGLSKDQKAALRIADNKIAEDATWDPVLLGNELRELIENDFEAELTGFDAIEIDRLLTPAPVIGD